MGEGDKAGEVGQRRLKRKSRSRPLSNRSLHASRSSGRGKRQTINALLFLNVCCVSGPNKQSTAFRSVAGIP